MIGKITEILRDDPLKTLALFAALIALATTPIAFAVLARIDWFRARRGRVMQKPEFWSVACGMALVMAIPAIFAALVIKSQDFDRDRYEFDPNKTWSVLDQGREFKSVKDADDAVRKEMERLAEERKNLVNAVKKLDDAMLAMRAASAQSPATAQTIPVVLDRLAAIRRAVKVDGPQQLMDFTAPPAALPASPPVVAASSFTRPETAMIPAPGTQPAGALVPKAPEGNGLSKAEAEAELATVPEPQRPLARMLPLDNVPKGWTVGKSGDKHLETFNADNLFEKIDGRAESFTQNNVIGMAYAYYHPDGDDSNEVQVYIFEFDHSKPFRAQSKYGTEKPEGAKPIKVGTEGYTSAGSLLFYVEPYYTQIVSTKDDPQFEAVSKQIAEQIAAVQAPAPPSGENPEGGEMVAKAPAITPDAMFALLPKTPDHGAPNFVTQDVFGYSFLSEVFMADYTDGDATWQGFLRPYATEDEAKATFAKYLDNAKQDGAEVKEIKAEGADEMISISNIGLIDVIFRRGSLVGGANGATDAAKAEAFAQAFAKGLPAQIPGMAPPPK
ncbi:DUF6599 family protein [Tundrisphaera sp. TA3]|uniref:DUF6599 family protein n=1 Tax=Tundrisphaera sp. TA3 TaxID=3435775 RepID=UPI003EB7976E